MNLLNKYHTNNRFIFSQNVWMAYSREMLNCDIEKKLKHDNIRYYPRRFIVRFIQLVQYYHNALSDHLPCMGLKDRICLTCQNYATTFTLVLLDIKIPGKANQVVLVR